MNFDAFYFDLDGTLYDNRCGLLDAVNERIAQWIPHVVDIPDDQLYEFRDEIFHKYGGTLLGLTIEYGSNYYESLRFCHDVPVENFISPNPLLKELLPGLPGRKYIFTTAYRFYAVRVLRALEILDCFDGIIDAVDVFPNVKPSPNAYQRALQITAEPNVQRCVFLDDQPRNVIAAHKEGFFAVQVRTEYPRDPLADAYIEKIEDLLTIPEFCPED